MSYRRRTLAQILDLQRENQALAPLAAQAEALAAECGRLRAANALLELEVMKLLWDKQALGQELLEAKTLLAFLQGQYGFHPTAQVHRVRVLGRLG